MEKTGEINHEYFEELGALSALGQITPQEFRELQAHTNSCSVCRARQAEFFEILHEHLPLLEGPSDVTHATRIDNGKVRGIRHRFLNRAYLEGLRFSEEALKETQHARWYERSWAEMLGANWQLAKLAYGVAMGLLCLATALLGILLRQTGTKYEAARNEQARLVSEVARLKSYADHVRPPRPASSSPVVADRTSGYISKDNSEFLKLGAALNQARQDYAGALERVRSLSGQLQNSTAVIADLQSELAAARSKLTGGDKLREAEVALQQANAEVARLSKEHSVQVAALASQQNQIRELTDKLYSQGENLERNRDMLATTQEIRDLMGARNLHIIDVADVDSRGTRKPFGRVFYTEGRSLVFYAYDLEKKRKSMEKFCFQAWGQVESKTGSVQNLGVFYADDQAQNRWVLKYDDPSVLTRIDSVFVTVEPVGGSLKPKGQQLMYAYLKANPNHP